MLFVPTGIVIAKRNSVRNSDVEGNRLGKADRLAKRYLSEAKKQLGKKEAFYVALEKALHNYLKAKLRIETSDISKEKLQYCSLKNVLTTMLSMLLSTCLKL